MILCYIFLLIGILAGSYLAEYFAQKRVNDSCEMKTCFNCYFIDARDRKTRCADPSTKCWVPRI